MAQTLTGTCHCKSTSYTVSLPPTLPLPLPGTYDHSTDLRLCIGFHFVLYTPIPTSIFTFTTTTNPSSKLTSFTTSTNRTLHFCPQCGTTFFFREQGTETISLLATTIDITTSSTGASPAHSMREFILPKHHIHLSESTPGIDRILSDNLPRFHHDISSPPWTSPPAVPKTTEPTTQLPGACYCTGVQFTIHRANESYTSSPLLREWVKPGLRYCASYCFCHSCRIVSGAPFWAWAFIPRPQIEFTADTSLRRYSSFRDSTRSVTRRFCGTCGCHLFFESTGAGGLMWDVAVAVLEGGGSGGGWFCWRFEGGERRGVDGYINSWVEGGWGFEGFGREYCREVVEEAKEGLEGWVG